MSDVIKMVVSPVPNDYFPETFIAEAQWLTDFESCGVSLPSTQALEAYKEVLPTGWHQWFEDYIAMIKAEKFPFIWSFSPAMMAFDFNQELDDFSRETKLFAIGSSPSGNWVVMEEGDEKVFECDQHNYELYNGFSTPNHLLACYLRSMLAEQNGLTASDTLAYWKSCDEKVEEQLLNIILRSLN